VSRFARKIPLIFLQCLPFPSIGIDPGQVIPIHLRSVMALKPFRLPSSILSPSFQGLQPRTGFFFPPRYAQLGPRQVRLSVSSLMPLPSKWDTTLLRSGLPFPVLPSSFFSYSLSPYLFRCVSEPPPCCQRRSVSQRRNGLLIYFFRSPVHAPHFHLVFGWGLCQNSGCRDLRFLGPCRTTSCSFFFFLSPFFPRAPADSGWHPRRVPKEFLPLVVLLYPPSRIHKIFPPSTPPLCF